jgi:hypothetical protein
MVKTKEDIERYLTQLDLPYEEVAENVWIIDDQTDRVGNIVVTFAEPLVIFRVRVMGVPKHGREELFAMLLELNANDMVAGAYGIEGDSIVITDTLQSENLDYNEFLASVDSLALSIKNHHSSLAKFHSAA